MTQPYQWRADPPDGTRASEPDVPVRPRPAAERKPVVPVPLVKPVPVPTAPPVATPKPIKPPARPPHAPDVKQEAAAALGAFNELGPGYEDAVIESFLARLDQMNAARQRPPMLPVQMPPPMVPAKPKSGAGAQTAMVITCIALAIPLTAIAGGMFGLIGLPITWAGIVIVALILGRGLGRD